MKIIVWDEQKNEVLKKQKWVCFEDVLIAEKLDDIKHKNKKKYPNQRMMVVRIRGYIYVCPYVEKENKIFLKTIFPDRRLLKKYK